MKNYIKILKKTKLFEGCSEDEILAMSDCLGAEVKAYKKGEYVLNAGSVSQSFGVLLEGKLTIQKDDYWGRRTIIASVLPGEMFGEAYSGSVLTIDVATEVESKVVWLNPVKIMNICSSACKFHRLVANNLFLAVSEKNRKLMEKITHISEKTTRDKIISYLSSFADKSGTSSFTIPFNRQQLADYLGVERSAMCNSLSKMRDQGLIIYKKNNFTLLLK